MFYDDRKRLGQTSRPGNNSINYIYTISAFWSEISTDLHLGDHRRLFENRQQKTTSRYMHFIETSLATPIRRSIFAKFIDYNLHMIYRWCCCCCRYALPRCRCVQFSHQFHHMYSPHFDWLDGKKRWNRMWMALTARGRGRMQFLFFYFWYTFSQNMRFTRKSSTGIILPKL